jgi:hypothetical protein
VNGRNGIHQFIQLCHLGRRIHGSAFMSVGRLIDQYHYAVIETSEMMTDQESLRLRVSFCCLNLN